jgi:hypothetical protein
MRVFPFLSALTLSVALHANASARGAMAFHYATPLTPAQLAWYERFDLLVTHDPLPRAQVEALHAHGTRLLLYEWAVAFYPSITHSSLPVLNAQPLFGHLGSATAGAYYYDPATREHAHDRAPALAARLRAIGYDGVFLDTTTHESVHPEALAEYGRRHPETPYDVAFARFLRALRRELRGGVIATNQGYRAAAQVLPYVDVDVTESLITRPGRGLRPWNDPHDRWNSIAWLMHHLMAPAQRQYPRVRFVHLNYVDALTDETIAPVIAIARLFDADAFVTLPSLVATTTSGVYFEDLGAAKRRVETKATAYRLFAHGLAAANFGSAPLTVRHHVIPPGEAALFVDR